MAFRSFSIPPLIPLHYSLLVVSCLASKFLQLALHWRSVSPLHFIVFLPTLFFQDVLVLVGGRILLRGFDGWVQQVCCFLGCFIAIVTYGSSAIQIGFFWETGSQVEWGASGSFLRDPAAMKILFSGTTTVCVVGAILFVVSAQIAPYLHTVAGNALQLAGRCIVRGKSVLSSSYTGFSSEKISCFFFSNWQVLLPTVTVGLYLLCVRLIRPDVPYDHLSATLPFSLSAAFHKSSKSCQLQRPEYPFQEFISPDRWQSPSGYYPGWRPGNDSLPTRPEWLPENSPPGFARWQTDAQRDARIKGVEEMMQQCKRKHEAYNPVTDPSKISNLQEAVHPKLKDAFDQNAVEIEHIVMLVLESARKEVFPMKEGTFLYDTIVNAHNDNDRETIIDKLSMLTPTAQMLTREYTTNSTGEKTTFAIDDVNWIDQTPSDMGGINVKGALTGSSLTLKSLLALHCGVMPLPVDMLKESFLDIYQPCLPHILGLFNSKKIVDEQELVNDTFQPVQDRPWKSVFIQPSTDSYDRQSNLTHQLGFDEKIVKETIENKTAAHYPPKTKTLNYFGYSEEELEPYMKDLIFEAAENKTRLFLSHLTLTTHHPWAYPETFKGEEYFRGRWSHRDVNSFLNTVRYVDAWVGKIMGHLEEAGIANRTLVVVVGDHGQAFEEDDGKQGTFENSHISNFKVPLLFRHPHLPQMDIEANVTTGLSVLPTVLDMLIESKSLNEADTAIARSLIHEYQGQSLLRPYIQREDQDGRRVWNLGISNAGGSLVAAMSADLPYRLVVPVAQHDYEMEEEEDNHGTNTDSLFEYRFTNTLVDPNEQDPLSRWTLTDLRRAVREEYGAEAEEWIEEARKMVRWWIAEQKRIWNYS